MEDVAVVIFTIFLILLVLLIAWGPSVIAILKRHYILGALGLLVFAPIGWIGALLLAKPDSWWARKRYDDAKRAEAIAKHGEPKVVAAPAAVVSGTEGDWACGICGEVSATKVAAESHVRGAHPQAPVESSISQASGT